jgi:hypothetical protein
MLFENPNAVYLEEFHSAVEWPQIKTLAFSYYNDIMYVGSSRTTHKELYKNARVKDPLAENREGRGKYAGRIYVTPQILTFWEFPESSTILKQLLADIEEETTIRFNNSWKVEVPVIYDKDIDINADWGSWHPRSGSQKFISINMYSGGFARSEKEMKQNHVELPIEKEKNKLKTDYARGFGSDRTSWDSPNNIKIRQAKTTSESTK